MGIKVTIDSRGIVQTDNSTTSLVVDTPVTFTNGVIATLVTSMSAGSTAVSTPGFYHLPSNSTASLPAASTQPGCTYIFSQPLGDLGIYNGGFLTGTSGCSLGTSAANAAIFFQNISGSVGQVGTNLGIRSNGVTLSRFASVSVTSDSKYWLVTALSGTVSGSLFPANG